MTSTSDLSHELWAIAQSPAPVADVVALIEAEVQKHIDDRCQCGYPMPCAATVPITFCRATLRPRFAEHNKG